jgi:hypothetical protein
LNREVLIECDFFRHIAQCWPRERHVGWIEIFDTVFSDQG